MKPEVSRCSTCKRRKTRSHPANNRYWLILHMLEDVDVPKVNENGEIIKDKNGVIVTTRHSADVWHHYAKSKWIGKEDVRLPNGSVITRVKSSAELTTDEFNKFMENVENFAAQWGVYLDAMETLT